MLLNVAECCLNTANYPPEFPQTTIGWQVSGNNNLRQFDLQKPVFGYIVCSRRKKEAVVHGETHYCLEEEERFIFSVTTMGIKGKMFGNF